MLPPLTSQDLMLPATSDSMGLGNEFWSSLVGGSEAQSQPTPQQLAPQQQQ